MARISPTPGLKITYFLFIFLASIILYFDITTDSFRDFKNGFKSSKIYGSYILRNISIEPAKKILTITKSKNPKIKVKIRNYIKVPHEVIKYKITNS